MEGRGEGKGGGMKIKYAPTGLLVTMSGFFLSGFSSGGKILIVGNPLIS